MEWQNIAPNQQPTPVQADSSDSHPADWAEIQSWMHLADVALNRWSKPSRCRERAHAKRAASWNSTAPSIVTQPPHSQVNSANDHDILFSCSFTGASVKKRILFVDDEPAIRATLPAILQREGFDVTATATVAEGLRCISERKFDVLIADLNIGTPGDGFTLVSAMRRTQPDAVTIILTGFPDFETALEAIRKQVDDYLTKPAEIPDLVAKIKEKIANPRRIRELPTKRVADVLRENSDQTVENWLAKSQVDSDLRVLPLGREQRIDNWRELMEGLIEMLETGSDQMPESQMQAAVRHGTQRARLQGYRIASLVSEARLLQQAITELLERELLTLELSTLIPDLLKLGEGLNALLEQSLQAFVRERRMEAA